VSKVIWQKAASPACHTSRLEWIRPILTPSNTWLDPHESIILPQTAPRSVQPVLYSSPVYPTQTNRQTTLSAIRSNRPHLMCNVQSMWPNNNNNNKAIVDILLRPRCAIFFSRSIIDSSNACHQASARCVHVAT